MKCFVCSKPLLNLDFKLYVGEITYYLCNKHFLEELIGHCSIKIGVEE